MSTSWFSVLCLFCFAVGSSAFLQNEDNYMIQHKNLFDSQLKSHVSHDYYDLMTIYDPVWMANLWPKLRNGAHLTIGNKCWGNLTLFFQEILDGRAWALSTVDSTGSFGSGLLWGNQFWIGSQEQCDDLDDRYIDAISNSTSHALSPMKYIASLNRYGENTGSSNFQGDAVNRDFLARMILLDNSPPFRMGYSTVTLFLNITKATLFSSHQVVLGVCLPQACHSSDVHELIDFSIKSYQGLGVSGVLPRSARVLRVRSLNRDYTLLDDPKFYIISLITLFILLLIITGTTVDIWAGDDVLEQDIELSQPSFKSFSKSDFNTDSRSERPLEFKNKTDKELYKSLQTLRAKKPTIPESTRTKDESAKKYSEKIPSLFPSDKTPIPKKQNDIKVKKVTKKDSDSITLDITIVKNGHCSSTVNTLSRDVEKRQKYVLSSEEPSGFTKIFNQIKNVNVFESLLCMEKESTLAKVLVCFSLKTNLGKIFSMEVGEDTLAPIHGMKFITLLWVILIHTCLAVFQLSDNKVYRGTIETNFLYQTLSNGTYSVDTFFVLSGLLVSYLYCQTTKKFTAERLGMEGGIVINIFQYIGIMIHRYIRLTPPYLLTIGLVELSSRYFSSHSALELPIKDHLNCERFWWRNALYINTFYPMQEMCMNWSWYLSNDTLFYAVGILALMLSPKHGKVASVLVAALLLSGWTTTALLTLRTGYKPSIENPLAHYDDIYDKPWTRVGPYLAGLGAGWGLSKSSCCLHISKTVSFSLWMLSLSTLGSIVYGLYGNDLTVYGSVAYVTVSHTAWGLAVAWILVACVTGYGGIVNSILSCRIFYPLSRLGYCAYLLHPLLLKAVFISAGAVLHIAPETMLVYFIGFTIISFALALIVSVIFEAPAVSLLRLIHPVRWSSERTTDYS